MSRGQLTPPAMEVSKLKTVNDAMIPWFGGCMATLVSLGGVSGSNPIKFRGVRMWTTDLLCFCLFGEAHPATDWGTVCRPEGLQ